MGGFDWASDSYLADALDAAEDRAERAEAYLAEQTSGRANLLHTLGSSFAGAATAGGLAVASQTVFKKDCKPGMPHVGPVPMTVPIGLLFKAAALFGWGKDKLPDSAYQYIDTMGQGMLDHAAVMWGLGFGAELSKEESKTKGTQDWEHAKHAYVEGNRAWEAAKKGYVRGNQPAPQVGATSSSHAPENYMTADQLRVWQSYAG